MECYCSEGRPRGRSGSEGIQMVVKRKVETANRATYDASEVAEKLGVNVKSIYAGIKSGQIPGIWICRRVKIPANWVDRKLDGSN
jgi:hypothetical protein